MIKKFSVLAIIPARGGSKGVKDKNIKDLNGKPLISHTIINASRSKYIDKVLVSTDSIKIAEISKLFGAHVPFLRPDEISGDDAKTIDAVIYTIEKLKEVTEQYDILILLQPTSPLRTTQDIDNALEIFLESSMQSLVSVCKVTESPVLMRTINNNMPKKILNINSTIRRQDMPQFYRVNGAIYINYIKEISRETSFNDNVIPFVMSIQNSIDIDSIDDFMLAEKFLKK